MWARQIIGLTLPGVNAVVEASFLRCARVARRADEGDALASND